MNIICGTDFSTPARNASDVATAIAGKLGDRVLLVHAIEGEDSAGLDPAGLTDLKARLGEHLAHEAQRAALSGIIVRETLEVGRADEVLARLSDQQHTRMVVVSSIGEHGGESSRVGSVAECIAATSGAPVLIVRDPSPLISWARGTRPLKILVAFDFTASSDAALIWAGELRTIGASQITVGYVGSREGLENEPQQQALIEDQLRRRVERSVGAQGVTLCVRTNAGAAAPALAAMAVEAGSDLLVSGAHQHSTWQQIVHGSVSQDLLRQTPMSVVCVPSTRNSVTAVAARPPERILVATDFSAQGNRAVAQACALAPAGSVVKVVHVATRGKGAEPGAVRRLRAAIPADAGRRGIRTLTEVIEGKHAADAIRKEADCFDADLICVGTKDRSTLSRASVGSVARTLVSRSKRPLLIIHPPEP